MSVLENFNESMNAITTLSSFIRHHLITTTFHELNASFLSKFLKSNQVQRPDKCEHQVNFECFNASLCKGGDPAAPSGTATLLRLHPSHEAHRGRRPPCG